MSETLYNISFLAITGEPEREAWIRAWLKRWKDHVRIAKVGGCGCCVVFWELEVSLDALLSVPRRKLCGCRWAESDDRLSHRTYNEHYGPNGSA